MKKLINTKKQAEIERLVDKKGLIGVKLISTKSFKVIYHNY